MSNTEPTPGSDLQVLINSQMVQKLIDSIEFPLRINFLEYETGPLEIHSYRSLDPDQQGTNQNTEEEQEQNSTIDAADAADAAPDHTPNCPKEIQDDVFVKANPHIELLPTTDAVSDEDLAGTIASASDYRLELDPDHRQSITDVEQQLAEQTHTADAPDDTNRLPGKKLSRFEVLGLSLEMVTPPEITIGNPVELTELTLRVRAKLRVHIQLLRKWRNFKLKIPWVTLHGQSANVYLHARDTAIFAVPELKNLKLAGSIKLFGKRLPLKLSIHQFVNKQIRRQLSLKIVDFGPIGDTMLAGIVRPELKIEELVDRPEGLLMRMNFCWREENREQRQRNEKQAKKKQADPIERPHEINARSLGSTQPLPEQN